MTEYAIGFVHGALSAVLLVGLLLALSGVGR